MIIWLCGRPGVGKSTTIRELEILLEERGVDYAVYDGTEVRGGADVVIVANAHDVPVEGAKVVFLESSKEPYIPESPDLRLERENTPKRNAEILVEWLWS